MAKQQTATRKKSRSRHENQHEGDRDQGKTGHEEAVERYEQELAGYLQERIKPGLNRGAIPLLARSLAREIANREHPGGASEDVDVEDEFDGEEGDEPEDEAEDEFDAEEDDEPEGEAEDEFDADEDDELDDEAEDESEGREDDEPDAQAKAPPDFEADMHDLQAELGEDWIVRFSVQGDEGWLTAEKEDGSQHVEATTASALIDAVELINEAGGRST